MTSESPSTPSPKHKNSDNNNHDYQYYQLQKQIIDNNIKLKWQAIIDKYSALDLANQGDIVDLHSGEIIEDNGHLRSLQLGKTGIGAAVVAGEEALTQRQDDQDIQPNAHDNGNANDSSTAITPTTTAVTPIRIINGELISTNGSAHSSAHSSAKRLIFSSRKRQGRRTRRRSSRSRSSRSSSSSSSASPNERKTSDTSAIGAQANATAQRKKGPTTRASMTMQQLIERNEVLSKIMDVPSRSTMSNQQPTASMSTRRMKKLKNLKDAESMANSPFLSLNDEEEEDLDILNLLGHGSRSHSRSSSGSGSGSSRRRHSTRQNKNDDGASERSIHDSPTTSRLSKMLDSVTLKENLSYKASDYRVSRRKLKSQMQPDSSLRSQSKDEGENRDKHNDGQAGAITARTNGDIDKRPESGKKKVNKEKDKIGNKVARLTTENSNNTDDIVEDSIGKSSENETMSEAVNENDTGGSESQSQSQSEPDNSSTDGGDVDVSANTTNNDNNADSHNERNGRKIIVVDVSTDTDADSDDVDGYDEDGKSRMGFKEEEQEGSFSYSNDETKSDSHSSNKDNNIPHTQLTSNNNNNNNKPLNFYNFNNFENFDNFDDSEVVLLNHDDLSELISKGKSDARSERNRTRDYTDRISSQSSDEVDADSEEEVFHDAKSFKDTSEELDDVHDNTSDSNNNNRGKNTDNDDDNDNDKENTSDELLAVELDDSGYVEDDELTFYNVSNDTGKDGHYNRNSSTASNNNNNNDVFYYGEIDSASDGDDEKEADDDTWNTMSNGNTFDDILDSSGNYNSGNSHINDNDNDTDEDKMFAGNNSDTTFFTKEDNDASEKKQESGSASFEIQDPESDFSNSSSSSSSSRNRGKASNRDSNILTSIQEDKDDYQHLQISPNHAQNPKPKLRTKESQHQQYFDQVNSPNTNFIIDADTDITTAINDDDDDESFKSALSKAEKLEKISPFGNSIAEGNNIGSISSKKGSNGNADGSGPSLTNVPNLQFIEPNQEQPTKPNLMEQSNPVPVKKWTAQRNINNYSDTKNKPEKKPRKISEASRLSSSNTFEKYARQIDEMFDGRKYDFDVDIDNGDTSPTKKIRLV